MRLRTPFHGFLMLWYEVYRDFASKYRKDLPSNWADLTRYSNAELSVMDTSKLEKIVEEMHAILFPDL